MLEVETFIPMVLQRQEDGVGRLKRVILIGDHHQLPPVVQNMAFQKYSHLDQSLFARFVRLGTPYVELNAQVCVVCFVCVCGGGVLSLDFQIFCASGSRLLVHNTCACAEVLAATPLRFRCCFCSVQGRARPSIAKLYNWRYGGLQDLPNVIQVGWLRTAGRWFGGGGCQGVGWQQFVLVL